MTIEQMLAGLHSMAEKSTAANIKPVPPKPKR